MINMMIMITTIQTAAELSALSRYHILIELLLFAYFSPIAVGVIFICIDQHVTLCPFVCMCNALPVFLYSVFLKKSALLV